MAFPEGKVMGDVNCEALLFEDESYTSVFGMDVLHHIPRPFKALEEMKRVVCWNPDSRIILIEPYVSLFSYLPYRIFHDEKTSLLNIKDITQPLVNEVPEDGNQTVPRWVFESKKGRLELAKIFSSEDFIIQTSYLSWLAFYLTRGLSNPSPIPAKVIRVFIDFERHIPQRVMKIIGSRMYISIMRRTNQC